MNPVSWILLAGLAIAGTSAPARGGGPSAGSLLLFPEFDNRRQSLTLFTITNTNIDDTHNQSTGLPNGTVRVHFVYVGRFDADGNTIPCLQTNSLVTLTPGDTFAFLTRAHNPQQQQGFMYAYAKHPTLGHPIRFDHLVGNALFLNGTKSVDYSTNALAFEGRTAPGSSTNVDGDANRDLDGIEYAQAPDQIAIPRFTGTTAVARSELILIGLSGGSAFQTVADLLVFNDNEEVFSAQRQFQCWERVPLDVVSGVFSDAFLKTTNHAANEPLGGGLSGRETGWILLDGSHSFSSAEQITDPAVFAVLVERVGRDTGGADLPFGKGTQVNGDLWPVGNLGDGGLGDNQ